MRKRIDWGWEVLDESTQRAKVIGGWLILRYMTSESDSNKKVTINFKESMVFVSDRDHEWEIMPPIVDVQMQRSTIANDFKAPKAN